MLNLFRSLRRAIETLTLWVMYLTWIFHFKCEEIVTPSNLKEDAEISGEIGLRKQGKGLSKHIGIIKDLVGFTVMSKSLASSSISLRILIGLLVKFLKQVSTAIRSSTNFFQSGNSFVRLLIMTEKSRGPRRVP